MEIKKREDIPENRQVRLTVAVDRGTWQEAPSSAAWVSSSDSSA